MNPEQYEANRARIVRSREALAKAHDRGEHREYVAKCSGCWDRAEIEQFAGIKRGPLVRLLARPWLVLPLVFIVGLLAWLGAWLS